MSDLDDLARAASKARTVSYRTPKDSFIPPQRRGREHTSIAVFCILACICGAISFGFGITVIGYGLNEGVVLFDSLKPVSREAGARFAGAVTAVYVASGISIIFFGILMIAVGLIGNLLRDVAIRLDA